MKKIFFAFLKIGSMAFGGAYSILAFFGKEFVDKKKWLKPSDFADSVAIGYVVPGAPTINTGIFIGYKLKKLKGALAAVAGLVMPAFIMIIVLAHSYIRYHDLKIIQSILKTIGASVVGLILSVVMSLGKTSIKNYRDLFLGISAFAGLTVFRINPIILIILAGLAGIMFYKREKL